jgi:beta-glucosidase
MILRNIILLLALSVFPGCTKNLKTANFRESYLDPSLPVDKRVELLLKEMTLEEKIGQMCQYVGEPSKSNALNNADEIVDYKLGMEDKASLIRKGLVGSFLKVPGYKEADYLQQQAEQSRLKIPLLIAK